MKKHNIKDCYVLTNREKNQVPHKGIIWCDSCDACMVEAGKKCMNCGQRRNTKGFKK